MFHVLGEAMCIGSLDHYLFVCEFCIVISEWTKIFDPEVECEGTEQCLQELSLLPINFFEQHSYIPICSTQYTLLSSLEGKEKMMSRFALKPGCPGIQNTHDGAFYKEEKRPDKIPFFFYSHIPYSHAFCVVK